MTHRVTLNELQIEKLSRGDSLKVKPGHSHVEIVIIPPCEGDHDWSNYRMYKESEVRRTCKNCGEQQEVTVDFDELFDDEGVEDD